MTLPFPQAYYGGGLISPIQPIAWWKRGTNLFEDTAGTNPATSAGNAVRRWDDVIAGYSLQQGGTGPNFPPELHSDLLAVRFDGDPNFLTGAATLAGLLSGTDVPFTAMFRIQSPNSFVANHNLWALRGTGGGTQPVHVWRFSSTAGGRFSTIRRDNATTTKTLDSIGASTDTLYTITHEFNGTSLDEYVNGSLTYTAGDLNVGVSTYNHLILGAGDAAGGGSYLRYVWDLLFFDHVITAQTRNYWQGVIS